MENHFLVSSLKGYYVNLLSEVYSFIVEDQKCSDVDMLGVCVSKHLPLTSAQPSSHSFFRFLGFFSTLTPHKTCLLCVDMLECVWESVCAHAPPALVVFM